MIEKLLDRLFSKRVIVNCERQPYLHRWFVIRTKRIALYVHKFVRSDEDRALHCHPWNFLVIPIWRGYIEHSKQRCDCWRCTCVNPSGPSLHPWHEAENRVYPIISARYRKAEFRHRVELFPCQSGGELACALAGLDTDINGMPVICKACQNTGFRPSWSLFVRFTKRRDWGFYMPEGFVQWAKFWQEKCE